METATRFSVGFVGKVPIGALLLVSELPLRESGVKTCGSAHAVFLLFTYLQIELGIESMGQITELGERTRHCRW